MGRYRATLNYSAPGTGRIAAGQVYDIPDDELEQWQSDIDEGWMVPVDAAPGSEVMPEVSAEAILAPTEAEAPPADEAPAPE